MLARNPLNGQFLKPVPPPKKSYARTALDLLCATQLLVIILLEAAVILPLALILTIEVWGWAAPLGDAIRLALC